jgi:hypothetical protein|tara:strand:+ start:321 stop:626 length:306 start_codon:yes stop_codon:yes gene_type:complete
MPYTPEELNELAFYQNLINEEEQKYLVKREQAQLSMALSGSSYAGTLLTRNSSGDIELFENPYTGELYDDETTILYVDRIVDQLKDDDSINGTINRDIREL